MKTLKILGLRGRVCRACDSNRKDLGIPEALNGQVPEVADAMRLEIEKPVNVKTPGSHWFISNIEI